ncbi:hypothetical protein PBS_05160 [Paraburkholderia sp. 2C]
MRGYAGAAVFTGLQRKRHRVPVIFDYKFAADDTAGPPMDAAQRMYRDVDAGKENARREPGMRVIRYCGALRNTECKRGLGGRSADLHVGEFAGDAGRHIRATNLHARR